MRPSDLLKKVPLERFQNPPPVVGVLRLSGVIAASQSPLRRGALNLHSIAKSIERAFSLSNLSAVALSINSPGGSPVQSALIAKRIRALAEEKEKPVYAFAEDVAASGGYWLACAGDHIYADENSIVGSIGVVFAGFGLQELIKRHGVERRLYTAGEHKATLDPFLPEKKDEVKRLKTTQDEIHESFKALVRDRRAGKLNAPEEELFSGEFWTGKRAEKMGLIDGLGDLRSVMREKFGDKVKLVPVGESGGWLQRRLGFAQTRGLGPAMRGNWQADWQASWAETAIAAIEDRLTWSRFGL